MKRSNDMPPLHVIDHWQERSDEDTIKPKSTFFFIVEGSNTEIWYLDQLFMNLSEEKFHDVFKLVLINREGDKDKTASHPSKLLEYGNWLIKNGIEDRYTYEKDLDEIVFVFDCDIYRGNESSYIEIMSSLEEIGMIGVTFPSFELFLLLHKKNAFHKYIETNKTELYENKKINKHKREINRLFSESYGFNPKKNEKETRKLAQYFNLAVKNERFLNQDKTKCLTCLTSNIGQTISKIVNNDL